MRLISGCLVYWQTSHISLSWKKKCSHDHQGINFSIYFILPPLPEPHLHYTFFSLLPTSTLPVTVSLFPLNLLPLPPVFTKITKYANASVTGKDEQKEVPLIFFIVIVKIFWVMKIYMHQCNLIKLNIQQPSLERGSKFILSLSPTLLLAQSKISKSLNKLESYPWEKLKQVRKLAMGKA